MKNETKHVAQPGAAADLNKQVVSVAQLLSAPGLAIPTYQRPYKWTSKNVNQLFGDIAAHRDKRSYRLGTIVFHRDEAGKLNIVDGQQRTITLLLTVRALSALGTGNLKRKDLCDQLAALASGMMNPEFPSKISQTNIRNNYLEICRIVERPEFTQELIDFVLNKCEVVTFVLDDISEAFQFFDSQNARGRDLDPHDLLKAYHLREFNEPDEQLKALTVAHWENCESEQLASLFANYLYRIRGWSKGRSAIHFRKDDTNLFKGVNIDTGARYPYADQLRIAHHFVDDYNRQYQRHIDGNKMAFPFRLDQVIINGRRFFEMTAHYQDRVAFITGDTEQVGKLAKARQLDGFAGAILEAINSYPGRHRSGDRYVRTIFDCLLICYIDKFGFEQISRAIEKIFIWAYSLRLKMQAVQLASMDNHVLDNDLFRLVNDATVPADFINQDAPLLEEYRSRNTDEIYTLFKDMRYVHE